MKRRLIAAVLASLLAPASALAETDDSTPKVLVVSGAALGGLALFFGLEAQLARSHEADPSTSREGLATAFTVVSLSALALAVASLGVSVFMVLSNDDAPVASMDFRPPLTIACPDLSCLPEVQR